MSDIKTLTIKGIDYSLKDETARNAISSYGNIVTHNTSEFATSTQGTLADTAIQPNDNISELNNDSNYQTGTQVDTSISTHNTSSTAHDDIRSAISEKQDTLTAGDNITIASDGKTISATDTTYTAGNGLTLTGTQFSANVVNNVTSTSTTNALSANQGKVLQEQINNLNTRGKYLSVWNCTTGLAMDEPPVNPYTVETGSYFIVGVVGTGTNYRPNGGTYDKNTPSTTVETDPVKPNDTYYYDGTLWRLLSTPEISAAFSTLAGNPEDNVNLKNDLDAKQATLVSGTNIKTVNSTSLLGSGNIAVQSTLVSGTNIKTINSTSVLGSGNISVQPTITGGASTITSSNLTTSRALVSNASGKVAVSDVTSTELGYLDGVTSAIQTQLNEKATDSSVLHTTGNETATGTKTLSLGSSTATTQGTSDNSTKVATTAYVVNILKALYPVGSIYIGTQSACPLSTLIPGSTWSLVSQDRSLQGSSGSHAAGSTIEAGLPNITGTFSGDSITGSSATGTGALYRSGGAGYRAGNESGSNRNSYIGFDASLSNAIYGNSNTVQPPAYVVNVWRRTA